MGAALLAGVGTGVVDSIAAGARRLVQFDRTFDPRPELRQFYADRYGQYRALYEALTPFNGRFGAS